MKTMIKKNAMALAALAIAAGSFGVMSFGNALKTTSKKQASYWYQVTPNPSNPNLDLVTTNPASPTDVPECSTTNEGQRCAVELNQPITSPMTIQDILDHPSIRKSANDRFRYE